MNLWIEIRNDINGAAILKDWLGEGMHPVSQELADHRSLACISGDNGQKCPHNRESKWWEKSKQAVAGVMLEQMAIKNKLQVTTPLEEHLGICDACGCCLPLKIHTPIEFIKAHTSDEQVKQFPAWCWIRQEIENS